MNDDLLQALPPATRRCAAQLLREHGSGIESRWRPRLEELFTGFDPLAQVRLVEALLALPSQLAYAIEVLDETRLTDHLWSLAETAWGHDVPYPAVSRALRHLNRSLRAILRGIEQIAVPAADVATLIEDQIDECRLRVNGFYHMFSEQLLRDSEQLSRFLLNHINQAVLVVSLENSRVRLVNAEAARLTGYRSAELLQRDLLDMVSPEHRAVIEGALKRCGTSGSTHIEPVALLTAEGDSLATGMTFVQVRHEQALRLAQVIVTESHATHDEGDAAQHGAFFEAFAEHTADAVMVVDLEDRVRFWNNGAERMFGYTAEEMLNEPVLRMLPPDSGPQELRQLNAIVERDGFVRDVEAVRLAKDGRAIDCNLTRTAVFDPATRRRIGTSVVVRDVTEKRRLEQDTARAARQLRIINRIMEATSRTLDRTETYRTIAAQIDELLPCDLLSISLPFADDQHVVVHVIKGDANYATDEELLIERDSTIREEAAWRQSPLRVNNLAAYSQLRTDDEQLVALGYRSVLVTPLVYDLEAIGTLMLCDRRPDRYSADDEELLGHLSGHFAVTLENARRFEEERKRSAQFELINRVGASAIANIGDVGRLLHSTVAAIQQDFGYHDVAMYEAADNDRVFRLRAHAGHRRGTLGESYEQPIDQGVFGEVHRTGGSYLVRDVSREPLYFNPVPDVEPARSELCVPIRVGPRVLGVLDVESDRPNGFDPLDQAAMEALAGLLARCMTADETLRQMRMFQALRRHIMEAVPSALLLLDEDLRVQFVNRRYLEFYGQHVDDVIGRYYTEVFPPSLIAESHMAELIEDLKNDLAPIDQREVRYFDHAGAERVADVRMRIVTEYQTNIVVMLHDATGRMARFYQLQMLREIGEEMQKILDISHLLRAILTCVTAGPGFGFNRAALYLLNKDTNELDETMRVGPSSLEEAGAIWREVSHKRTLSEFLRAYDEVHEDLGRRRTKRSIRLTDADNDLHQWRTPLLLRHDKLGGMMPAATLLWQSSGAPEMVVVPLVSQEQVRGLIIADNLFTGEPIEPQDIDTLAVFANQAGVAMANAQAFAELEQSLSQLRQAQQQLRLVERLAGVGRVASHVAHEIRNPLVSIGGFARRAIRRADFPDEVRDYLGIVIEEVQRLERILKNVMDFTAPGKPQLRPCQVNSVLGEVVAMQAPVLDEHNVRVAMHLADELPEVIVDPDKTKQVILNLVRNAIQAMGRDGTLTLSSRSVPEANQVEVVVQDSGPGIPEDKIEEIFNPFYTRKADGTGLGLAVSHKMVVDHGGELTCASRLGEGARFIIRLPLDATASVAALYGSES
ncbi:MAG: PAS domain S-box protein [Armatimonadetes bacterium]|nr:PAS domain S-box protein [Armatimonadota bacterium]